MKKKGIDPANAQTRPMKEKDVDAIAARCSVRLGASRAEYSCEKLGLATKGVGIDAPLVAETRSMMSQIK